MKHISWIIKDKLATRPGPLEVPCDIDEIKLLGLKSIISLSNENEAKDVIEAGLRHLPCYISDNPLASHDEISSYVRRLQAVVDLIHNELSSNNATLVHCHAGKDRTGSAIAAYLIRHEKYPASKALSYIRSFRNCCTSPGYESAVYEFEKQEKVKPVILEKYNPKWKELFVNEAKLIHNVLNDECKIEHVGSTAIKGLISKPCIDILVSIPDFLKVNTAILKLKSIQYEVDEGAGENGSRVFLYKGQYPLRFHIHLVENHSESAWKLIVFRDYIANNPKAKEEYIELKIALQKQYPLERPKYTKAKADFIKKILLCSRLDYTDIKELKKSDGIESLLQIMMSFENIRKDEILVRKQLEQEVSENGDNRIIYVAYWNNKPIVSVQLILKNADNDPELANGKDIAHIHALWVKYDLQRQGLGKRMMEFLENKAKELEIKVLTLGVDDLNTGAVNLYRKMNYIIFKEELGRIEGEKVFLMKKNICVNKENWLNPKIEIRETIEMGRGMYATQNIYAGEVLVIWGKDYTNTKGAKEAIADGKHFMQWDTDLFSIENENEANDSIYAINHSCDSNTWMKDAITLIAKLNIDVDEQITADYALWESDENYISQWECNCGSLICRKRITGKDWRLPEIQVRYRDHFSPLINKRIQTHK